MVTLDSDFSQLGRQLSALSDTEVRFNEPLSKHTTLRIGGCASLWVECVVRDAEYAHIAQIVSFCKSHGASFTVVGGGSNILASDGGYQGVVIRLIEPTPPLVVGGNQISVSAAVSLADLVRVSVASGFCDLEFLCGIPGSVGGALVMNAGTAHQWIGSVVAAVDALVYEDMPDPRIRTFGNDEIQWGYRESSLRDCVLVLGATFRLQKRDDADAIGARIKERLAIRKASQPLNLPNAGSIFRNPDGDSAGRLIEAVGLKGYRCGAAQFSTTHANFIVNRGNATAAEVRSLISEAQTRVYTEYGVRLQKEIRLLGSEA